MSLRESVDFLKRVLPWHRSSTAVNIQDMFAERIIKPGKYWKDVKKKRFVLVVCLSSPLAHRDHAAWMALRLKGLDDAVPLCNVVVHSPGDIELTFPHVRVHQRYEYSDNSAGSFSHIPDVRQSRNSQLSADNASTAQLCTIRIRLSSARKYLCTKLLIKFASCPIHHTPCLNNC